MSTPDKHRLARLFDRALEIAQERRALLDRIYEAHVRGDRDAVFELAGRLAGVPLDMSHVRENARGADRFLGKEHSTPGKP